MVMRRYSTAAPPARLERPSLPVKGLRPIVLGQEICRDFSKAFSKEWVVTNGLGGYASSTVLGMNTRSVHGLLAVAQRPPMGRLMLLSKVEETLVTPAGRYELAVNQYQGMVHPEGYRYLVEFRLDPWPTFLYQVGQILLEKSVFLLPGENALVVGYTLHSAAGPLEMTVRPLLAFRGIAALRREDPQTTPEVHKSAGRVSIQFEPHLPPLVIQHTAELMEESPCWFQGVEYAESPADGLKVADRGPQGTGDRLTPLREDLWSPGYLRYLLQIGESHTFVASTGRRGGTDLTFHQRRIENTQAVLAQTMKLPETSALGVRLGWMGQQFVARQTHQETGETFLMKGLPELPASGREALLALPGLALSTGRFDLARSVLETLAAHLKGGLIPVRFSEADGSPEYDSADTSLWFFVAVWQYWKATKDFDFVSKKVLEPMRAILEAYLEGTTFGIGMDDDGLIELADEEVALTWMNACLPVLPRRRLKESTPGQHRHGAAVTPRFGKPVEINALWYAALMIMTVFAERAGWKQTASYRRLAQLVEKSFVRRFICPQGGLYDRITRRGADASIRPNMLIATSLPFCPTKKEQAESVLSVATAHLLTPVGIRTLSPADPAYRGQCGLEPKAKALALHQGTVWVWLLGPYIRSLVAVRRLTQTTQASVEKQLRPFLSESEKRCLGGVGAMFDGDPPHTPRGDLCDLAAVGELVRCLTDARLGGVSC